jgi:hypothetical protein
VAIEVFLVIPPNPANPAVSATPTTDLYLETFTNAAVIPIDGSEVSRLVILADQTIRASRSWSRPGVTKAAL